MDNFFKITIQGKVYMSDSYGVDNAVFSAMRRHMKYLARGGRQPIAPLSAIPNHPNTRPLEGTLRWELVERPRGMSKAEFFRQEEAGPLEVGEA